MSGSILDRFDEINQNFDFREGEKEKHVGNLFTLLGNSQQFLAGTYNALIKRPELFGSNAANLLYAMDVGRSFRNDTLYLMFEGFLNKPPQTTESNIIFMWAEHLRKTNEFIVFEPVFSKLNEILQDWFGKKTVNYEGKVVPLEEFRPILYNSAGVNLIELIPYIAYIFTYHIYGMPFKFSDGLSSSSTKEYLSSLEGWLMTNYGILYQDEHRNQNNGIDMLDIQMDNESISDEHWIAFYNRVLDSSEIVRLRNEEIQKTDGLLDGMIHDQNGLNKDDLANRFNHVLTKLVKISIQNSGFNIISQKIKPFDASYYDVVELVNITSYIISGCENGIMIDPSNERYKYQLLDKKYESLSKYISPSIPSFGLKNLMYCIGKPFCAGDVMLEMFKGINKQKFEERRGLFSLLAEPIHINPNDLDNENIYPFILNFFVNGIWQTEGNEMKKLMEYFEKNKETNQYLQDLFNLHKTLTFIYGNTTQSILVPIYIISYLNSWILTYCDMNMDLSKFNPFIFMKSMVADEYRIIKLQNMLYSTLFLNNSSYINLVNMQIDRFIKLMTNNPIILQPYVQSFNDDVNIFALGGCDTYKYLKFSNPFIRGYGFISNVMEINEDIYVINQFTSQIKTTSIFDLVMDENSDERTIVNNIATIIKNENISINHLFKYNFEINENNIKYNERSKTEVVDIKYKDHYLLAIILNYAFRRTSEDEVLPNEKIRIKRYEMLDNKLNPSITSTENGWYNNSNFISLSLNSETGMAKYLPVYNYASKFEGRNIVIIHPDGKNLVEIISPSTMNAENNLFWIFTSVRREGIFEESEGVKLVESGFQPKSGSFMLTDRLKPLSKGPN